MPPDAEPVIPARRLTEIASEIRGLSPPIPITESRISAKADSEAMTEPNPTRLAVLKIGSSEAWAPASSEAVSLGTREAALASLQSAELSVGEARLAFLSSLVSTYLDLRYYQQAMALTRQTIASQSETLSLARNRAAAGAATSLEVAQAEAAYEQARAQLPGLESGYYASLYAIATLLAVPVQEIQGPLQTGGGQPLPRGASNPGVPADLLRNRPDVRAAERDYAAAVAGVGVSTAQLYPSLTLAGTVTATGTNTWGFGPTLSIPVLNRPSLLAARDQSKAQAEQARLAWQASVLGAVEDVQSRISPVSSAVSGQGCRRVSLCLSMLLGTNRRHILDLRGAIPPLANCSPKHEHRCNR